MHLRGHPRKSGSRDVFAAPLDVELAPKGVFQPVSMVLQGFWNALVRRQSQL